MSFLRVKENTSFVRDTQSKAVLNTDIDALKEYYAKRELVKKEKQEKIETKEKLAKLENDIEEIKKLLIDIAALRKNNG